MKFCRNCCVVWLLWTTFTVLSSANKEYRRHTNNWAVVVDTSRFWNNYRHIANALSLYHSVKRLGIPDSQIILMLADQMPCNPRNCFPGEVFNSRSQEINLYGNDVEVDYRGAEVTVANFITVLTGRHEPNTPASKKLDSDENSNIFIFMTGHGGEGFLKFQDYEELSSEDIADTFREMHVKKRYNEIFVMVDTCQAGSLANAIVSPNVVTIGSSKTGESSYAHHSDEDVGVAVIDRFTFATLDFLQRMKVGDSIRSSVTLRDLFNFYDPHMLYSTPDYRIDMLGRSIDRVPITDFLGSMLDIYLHDEKDAYVVHGEVIPVKVDNSVASIPVVSASSNELKGLQCVHRGRQRNFQFSRTFVQLLIVFLLAAVAVMTIKV